MTAVTVDDLVKIIATVLAEPDAHSEKIAKRIIWKVGGRTLEVVPQPHVFMSPVIMMGSCACGCGGVTGKCACARCAESGWLAR